MATAFLLTYIIATKFSDIRKTVSISLAMFLSALPDIDILLRLIGIDFGHRTITHSVFFPAILGCMIICFVPKCQRVQVLIYLMAYLSHILIGDYIIGPINILYPLRIQLETLVIYESLLHIAIEFGLLSIMTAFIVVAYYSYKRKREIYNDSSAIFLFRYHRKLDELFYPTMILALVISPIYLLYNLGFDAIYLSSSEHPAIVLLILILHLAAIFVIMSMWIVSRRIS
jgi:hypothetical protein